MFTNGDISPIAVLPTPMLGTRITSRAYFNRIGVANSVWLYTQAKTDPTLEYYRDKVWSAPVDLADPETSVDLNYLLTAPNTPFNPEIISAILINPVLPSEVPD